MYNEYKEDSIMTEDTRKFVEEKTKEILNAGSCKGRDRSISSGII